MALNMQDPNLLAERQPPTIEALGDRLRAAYGVGPDAFGCKGNEYHYTGFHRSRNYLLGPTGPGPDYSTSGSKNQGGNGDNCSAWDFTPGEWGTQENRRRMIELTTRAHNAAVAKDPRLSDYYEIAGTLDGMNVVTFYASGDQAGQFKTPFDPSHLDHLHASKYRNNSDNDDTGIGDVLLGIPLAGEEDEHMSMGAIVIGPKETSISVPGGAAGRGNVQKWLAICNETNIINGKRPPYALRVVATTGDNSWTAVFHDAAGKLTMLPKFDSGKVQGFTLPLGVRSVRIVRAPIGPDGKVYDPEGDPHVIPADAVVYDGSLSCSIEG